MMTYVECSFLVPIRGDESLGEGHEHADELWYRLQIELYARFGGHTVSPGLYHGTYRDPDTHEPVSDMSRKYAVALAGERLDELREVLSVAAVLFQQKCIYLSVAGRVEFVGAPHEIDLERLSRFGGA